MVISCQDSGLSGLSLSPGTALCSWARHFTLIVRLSPRCINRYW